MIDWKRVRELSDEIGVEDFDEVVELFLQEMESALADLRSAHTPPEALEDQLHFLKGSALNLGFSAVAQLCQAGETAAADGRAASVDLGEIAQTYDESRLEFLSDLQDYLAA